MAVTFEARYEGTCPAGDDIEVGESVKYDDDDHLWHVGCLAIDQDTRRRHEAMVADVCTECWLVKPCEHSERGVVVR